jgi:uncharacterized protein YyaL (SSP411 family)
MSGENRTPNRLAGSTSPYLLQHAYNPVDWYPWGPEALERARREDRPILLSIGYAACHWCHVMEHESFEDADIARLMNEHFVCIKVDREERPDLDDIYMSAVQMLTGSGGWPMTVFLKPDGSPFYGGTYFPPDERWGRVGMRRLVPEIARVWREQRDDVDAQAADLSRAVVSIVSGSADGARLPVRAAIDQAVVRMLQNHDDEWGGFGGAPKFPPAMGVSLLLARYVETRDARIEPVVRTTLNRMARGGLYDHLGGGFARYSVDERWQVPHFEKMLYDNALLLSAYAEALVVLGDTPDGLYTRVLRETIDFVARELTDPAGGFYSSLDADSEGEEGKFYAWTLAEVEAVLGPGDGALLAEAYDVTPEGNWEHGRSVIWRPDGTAPENEAILAPLRARLFAARAARVRPGLDDKVLAAWNGLMVSGLVRAATALAVSGAGAEAGAGAATPEASAASHAVAALEAARRAADFALRELRGPDGRLRRSWRQGTAAHAAYVEDYAALALGLVDLYEATFEPRWLREASALVEQAVALYADATNGGFFLTAHDAEDLLARPKGAYDGATPSPNALMAEALFRLSALLDRADWRTRAEGTVAAFVASIEGTPGAHHRLLRVLDALTGDSIEVAIVGPRGHAATEALLDVVRRSGRPNRVVAFLDTAAPEAEAKAARDLIPLLRDRMPPAGAVAAAWVCRSFACRAPVTTPEALTAELETYE